ncbi:hypothetical protein JCM21531_4243 [Acetivibrio straminisolvens JCM 21531]|uniref:Uncharacterized protein n=1 Tax=Acetivibrio straminisolvens JCM 21531 TaxID=1294263 RepID=W4VBP2_9FIRM|nr:hypothetical protein JCM21531_4243 [Acetivibrio straminisolvens JCM 21531]
MVTEQKIFIKAPYHDVYYKVVLTGQKYSFHRTVLWNILSLDVTVKFYIYIAGTPLRETDSSPTLHSWLITLSSFVN